MSTIVSSTTGCLSVFMLVSWQQIYDFPVIIFDSISYKLELVRNIFFLMIYSACLLFHVLQAVYIQEITHFMHTCLHIRELSNPTPSHTLLIIAVKILSVSLLLLLCFHFKMAAQRKHFNFLVNSVISLLTKISYFFYLNNNFCLSKRVAFQILL